MTNYVLVGVANLTAQTLKEYKGKYFLHETESDIIIAQKGRYGNDSFK